MGGVRDRINWEMFIDEIKAIHITNGSTWKVIVCNYSVFFQTSSETWTFELIYKMYY